MKHFRTFLLVIGLLLATGPIMAAAQHVHNGSNNKASAVQGSGMMSMTNDSMAASIEGGGMMTSMKGGSMMSRMHNAVMPEMRQIMQDPLKSSSMLVRVLPALKEELNLTADQVEFLGIERSAFEQRITELSEKIEAGDAQAHELLSQSNVDVTAVGQVLRSTALLRVEFEMIGLETAAKIKNHLTGQQRDQLSSLKPMQIHHAMMTRLTMMDMMRAMGNDMMPCSEMMTQMKSSNSMMGSMPARNM